MHDTTVFKYNTANNTWSHLEDINEFYYTYFIYPSNSVAFKFSNAIYLGIYTYPHLELSEADLERLE